MFYLSPQVYMAQNIIGASLTACRANQLQSQGMIPSFSSTRLFTHVWPPHIQLSCWKSALGAYSYCFEDAYLFVC